MESLEVVSDAPQRPEPYPNAAPTRPSDKLLRYTVYCGIRCILHDGIGSGRCSVYASVAAVRVLLRSDDLAGDCWDGEAFDDVDDKERDTYLAGVARNETGTGKSSDASSEY